MNLNDHNPVFQGSKHTHKEYTDQLFAAWCAVTVLEKDRSKFEGIVSMLTEDGKRAFAKLPPDHYSPTVCSTGGVLVLTYKRTEPNGRVYYQHEVCITICHRYCESH